MKVYNKLVRDKIPEIIEADGKVCRTHILSNEEWGVVWGEGFYRSWISTNAGKWGDKND